MSNKLTEMIDQLVLEKTVSLDALNAINKLKEEAARLEGQLKSAYEQHDRDTKRLGDLQGELRVSQEQHLHVASLLDGAQKKILEIQKIELEGKEAKAELKGFREAMQMVFKPSVVRETIHKTVPVAVEGNPGGNGAYASPGFVTLHPESGTIERTAE